MALALAVGPGGAGAQTAPQAEDQTRTAEGDEVESGLQALARALASQAPMTEQVEALNAQAAENAERIERLAEQIRQQSEMLEASRAIMQELAKGLAATGAQEERLARLEEQAENSAAGASKLVRDTLKAQKQQLEEFRQAMREGATETKLQSKFDAMKQGERELHRDMRERDREIENRFAQRCNGVAIDEVTRTQLRPHVRGEVPKHWNIELARTATKHKIATPACMKNDAGEDDLKKDIEQIRRDLEAMERSEEEQIALFIAMIAASPLIISVKIMRWLVNLFKSGGGGDADKSKGEKRGGGDTDKGKGEKKGGGSQGEGRTVGRPAKEDETYHRREEEQKQNDGEEGATGEKNPKESERPPSPAEWKASANTHTNVVEGAGITLERWGELLTFTDLRTRQQWSAVWPPVSDDPSRGKLPPFDDRVTVVEASVKARTMTIRMPMESCEGKVATLKIGADESALGSEQLRVKESSNGCVW